MLKTKKRVARKRPAERLVREGQPADASAAQLFDRVATEVIHGHRELFDTLSVHEREVVIQWLAEAVTDDNSFSHIGDIIWEIDYRRKPVSIETFIEDPYYLGQQCSELHDNWKNDLSTVFAPGAGYMEWIFTGGIGIGKTTVAMAAIAYKIHQISCLRNPAKYYGLLSDSLIVFGIYSITKRQVADTGYFRLKGYLDASPYFAHEFPRSKKIDSKVDFEPTTGMKLQVIPGSQELHALGLDMFSFSLDEANFMREKQDKERGKVTGQAYTLYNAVHTRMVSRFLRPGGVVPGIMVLMSSRNAQTSFLEEHLRRVNQTDSPTGKPTTFVSDYALWEVKQAYKFTKPKFKIEVGDKTAASRILPKGEKPRKEARVIEVPGEYLKYFQEDTDQALRDIAGVATFNLTPLIRDRQSVFDAVREDLKHPFKREAITISVGDDIQIADYWDMRSFCRMQRGNWVPRINPEAPRVIHVDTALSGDCVGIAAAHMSGMLRHTKLMPDGTEVMRTDPFVIVDFMLRILPPPGYEIELGKIRAFIRYLRSQAHVPICLVTTDGFQSADMRQQLQKDNFETKLQSLDRDDVPYLTLRSALFERRLATYHYEPFEQEVLDLERHIKPGKVNGNVDHPTRASTGGKGSKDVSDAVCGSVHGCHTFPAAMYTPPEFAGVEMPKSKSVVDPNSDAIKQSLQRQRKIKTTTGQTIDWDKLKKEL
jgi:hypothetical protein